MDKTSLGDRMKRYEKANSLSFTGRMPLIIRLDGKAFHTLTAKLDKPYDEEFKNLMMQTAKNLVREIMGCKFAYVQSDEISLLLTDYDKLETGAWYDKQIQKIVSVSASIATAYFNLNYRAFIDGKKITQSIGLFDSRAFVLPKEEVCNYFIWRQQDATRNSIQGLGQAHFSHKEIQGVNNNDLQDKLMVEKGINWNDIQPYFKRGGAILRDDMITVCEEIPQFTKNRNYIEQYVYIRDDDSIKRKIRGEASSLLEDEELPEPIEPSEIASHANTLLDEVDRVNDIPIVHSDEANHASTLLEGTEENEAGIKKMGEINHEVGGTKVNLDIENEEE
jgi:tRNA(His) guanylyltransferase